MQKLIATLLLLASCSAMALPSPADVAQAVNSGRLSEAEGMVREVIKEHPSAKAHYNLGEILSRLSRHKEALDELNEAKRLDPTLKFASSPAFFKKVYAAEDAFVHPQDVSVESPAPVVHSAPVESPARSAPELKSEDSGFSLGASLFVFLGFFASAVAILLFLQSRSNKQSEAAEAERTKKLIGEQKAALVPLLERLREAEMLCKTADYETSVKDVILGELDGTRSSVTEAVGYAKNGTVQPSECIKHLVREVESVEKAVKTGKSVKQTANEAFAAASQREPAWRRDPSTFSRPQTTSPAAPSVHHHYHSAPAAPVQSSGDGLLTGILIGSALSDHHRETVVVREQPTYTPRNDPPPKALDFDTGKNDGGWAPAADTGFDSGNNNTWD